MFSFALKRGFLIATAALVFVSAGASVWAQYPPPPPVPAPPVPDPGQPPAPPIDPNPTLPTPPVADASQPATAEAGRLIHGRQLIGMPIWGVNDARLGIVKDFIIDVRGDCPTVYFAVAPEIGTMTSQYVIVPFDAFTFSPDVRQPLSHLTLALDLDTLRRAPHLEANRWNAASDRRFFTQARDFYRRVERTAARPDLEERRDNRTLRAEERRTPEDLRREERERSTMPPVPNRDRRDERPNVRPPVNQPAAGTLPGTATQHGAETRPETVPAPSRPEPERGR